MNKVEFASKFYIPPEDDSTSIRHLFGMAKFHRWTRSFPDQMVEHDLPNIVHLSASMSAYFALGFPETDTAHMVLGCQLAEADWLGLIDVAGLSIDTNNSHLYIIFKGYTSFSQSLPPLAIGIHLNSSWKARNLQKYSKIDFSLIDVKAGQISNGNPKAFKFGLDIYHSAPAVLLKEAAEGASEVRETIASKIERIL